MTDEPADPEDPALLRQQLDTANQRLIQAELRHEATRLGILDLQGLQLFDTSALKLDEHGEIPGAATAMADFKRDKPWLFSRSNTSHPATAPAPIAPKTRNAKDMTYDEWQAARNRLIRGR